MKVLGMISDTLCGMLLPAVLFVAGAMFFIRIARYVFSPRFFFGGLSGGKSALSSLWLALGGTLGVGNICGVASAIYFGGAGCVFWIWVCALLSAVTKYAEVTLAVHFRKKTEGDYSGGAHHYIKNALGSDFLAKLFCVLCILTAFTMGNITQVKVAADFARLSLNIPTVLFAAVFFFAVLILALGKGRAIISFTSRVVPFLCVLYTALSFICIFIYRENIPSVTQRIISEAFTPKAGMGGVLGFLCSPALRLGITRGVMSNEAGCGTAPIAYAAEPSATPIKSGVLGICEVLVDTLILCTLTAYAILLPSIPLVENSAMAVISAFSLTLGRWVVPALALSVFFFALASVAAWAFYAESSARFLGTGKRFSVIFAILYAFSAFFGCFMSEGIVWSLADIFVSAMAVINISVMILLFGKVKKITVSEYQNLKYIRYEGKKD